MFKENNISNKNEVHNQDIEDAINAYRQSGENLEKVKNEYIEFKVASELRANNSKNKIEFLNRVYDKYKTHADLLMNLDNYRHMYQDVDRLLNFYNKLDDNLNREGFDFVSFEKELDAMISENLNKIEERQRAKAADDANFKKDLDNLFSTFLQK